MVTDVNLHPYNQGRTPFMPLHHGSPHNIIIETEPTVRCDAVMQVDTKTSG